VFGHINRSQVNTSIGSVSSLIELIMSQELMFSLDLRAHVQKTNINIRKMKMGTKKALKLKYQPQDFSLMILRHQLMILKIPGKG